jgi:VCBS repeat-containing protein
MTMVPGPGDAIDSGDNAAAAALAVDQRGFIRPDNSIIDIGAVEVQLLVDAIDDAFTVSEDGTLSGNVRDNDSSDGATVTGNTDPAAGTLAAPVAADGSFEYDPNGAFESLAVGETGTDTFTYDISNGSTDTATVTVTINGVNSYPTAVDDTGFVTHKATTHVFSSASLAANDTDPDTSDTLKVGGVVNGTTAQGAHVTFRATDNSITYNPGASVTLQAETRRRLKSPSIRQRPGRSTAR